MDSSIRDLSQVLKVVLKACEQAGKEIQEVRQSTDLQVQTKSNSRDLVTVADTRAEKAVLKILTTEFPDYQILSEETPLLAPIDYNKPVWIIDPVDGTTNYAYGHPQVGISVALMIEQKVQIGVVAAPFQGETFWAIRGQGSYCNGERLQVREAGSLSEALIGTGFPYDRSEGVMAEVFPRLQRLLPLCRDIRRIGACSLDLCWVACGRLDGYYENVSPWDMAAGALIAREAGAKVGWIQQNPAHVSTKRDSRYLTSLPEELQSRTLILGSPKVYDELREVLEEDAK